MPSRDQLIRWWPWLATAATLLLTVLALRLEGRPWFGPSGELGVFAGAWTPHTSQHFLDPYSLTHVEHGLVLYWLLKWTLPRWQWPARFWLGTLIEALWEVLENTPWVIQRYREATAALGYMGDSVVNVVGDIVSCSVGLRLAPSLGLRGTIALFVAMELALVFWIRDNLLLNVVMLVYSPQWLQDWQMEN